MSAVTLLPHTSHTDTGYQVLARKYRPQTFAALKGQDVLVQILTNGLRSGRLPHAFVLTGIRGVGKTTTARILARALNCTGRNIQETVEPCGTCDACQSIMQDRFIDVIEMDAASRTGIDDIREVIESAKYKPVAGRFKVYIIDEVHMLSKSAFNGLLKTLEEPPAHVKFIFATTEIRKIPKTVLSRCMRFDLDRLDLQTLIEHFQEIAQHEHFQLDARAAALIARAADGSARDGVSILDQAVTLSNGHVTAAMVENMLGIGGREQIWSLWRAAAAGDASGALNVAEQMYMQGTESLIILQDLLELTHTLTMLKVVPTQNEEDLALYQDALDQLTYPTLTRLWQIYLKGLEELKASPNPYHALQMLLIRVAYASQLPTPEEIVKQISSPASASSSTTPMPVESKAPKVVNSFEDIVRLARDHREALLQTYLHQDVRVISFEVGKIVLNIPSFVPADFVRHLNRKLVEWTGQAWQIDLSQEETGISLKKQEEDQKAELITELAQEPLARQVLEAFPGAEIRDAQPLRQS